MTDWDNENPNETDGIKALRKKFKDQGAEIQSLKDALARTLEREKSQNVYEALANRGVDPRVAKFYPKDASTDDAAVDEWVTENKDLFGNREVLTPDGSASDTLTDAEKRGYQIQKDISAYEGALQMDLKSRLDKIEYDRTNPEKAQNEVLEVLKQFDGVINT